MYVYACLCSSCPLTVLTYDPSPSHGYKVALFVSNVISVNSFKIP